MTGGQETAFRAGWTKTMILKFFVVDEEFQVYLSFKEPVMLMDPPDITFLAMDRGDKAPVKNITVEYQKDR
jgi:hypothetical protein